MSEVLAQIAFDVQVLQAHFEEGAVDRRFVESRADDIVSFALLLRDVAGARANRSSPAWQEVEAHLAETNGPL